MSNTLDFVTNEQRNIQTPHTGVIKNNKWSDQLLTKITLPTWSHCMFQSMTEPCSGKTNTKYAKEGKIKMKEGSLLHTLNRTGVLHYLLQLLYY
jgi:hypothetical protein